MKTVILVIFVLLVVFSVSTFSQNNECQEIEGIFKSSNLDAGKYWIPLSDGESQWSSQDYTRNPFSYKTYEPLKREKMSFFLFGNDYGYIRVSNMEGKIGWVVEDSGCTIKIK